MQEEDIKISVSTHEIKPIILTTSQKRQIKNMVHSLIKSIISDIDRKKNTRKITKKPNTYVQRRIGTLHYMRHGLTAGSTIRTITKKDWWQASIQCKQEVHSLSEYACLETFLQKHTGNDQNNSVDKLSEYIVKKYFEQNLSPKSIAKIKNTFIKDLERKPSTSYAVVEVFGLRIRQSKIMLTKKLQIARVTKRDLEIEKMHLWENTDHGIYPDAMYRFESDAKIPVRHMVKLVTAALCLYKVGAVRVGQMIFYSDFRS